MRAHVLAADALPAPPAADDPAAVVAFWREAGPERWFAKDPVFDAAFRNRFLATHEAAAAGACSDWAETPEGALALAILLDQFPRNAFRGTPRMYATDPQARAVADAAFRAGHDRAVERPLAIFFLLPFGHSEDLADQDRSVALAQDFDPPTPDRAAHHRELVRRFGRFPHRNPILGRAMRPEEQAYLDAGGYAG